MGSHFQNQNYEQICHRTASRPFSIHHTLVSPGVELALYLHYHSEMELFYLESGCIELYVEESRYIIKAGEGAFIPPNLLHYARRRCPDNQPCSFYAIVFDYKMILDMSPSYCNQYIHPVIHNVLNCILHISLDKDWCHDILNYLVPIFTMTGNNVESYELELRGRLLIIWQIMYNNHLSGINTNNQYGHMYPQLSSCIKYIDEHFTENLDLSLLASLSGMSEGYYCKVFKEFTGFSPFTYINRRRIMESCNYLRDTNDSIAQIAVKCGYNNVSYYNRTFLKIMHETPSSYRKR